MEKLLPDRLKELWQSVDREQLTVEEFYMKQQQLFSEYQNEWLHALLLEGFQDLHKSLLSELSMYLGSGSLAEVEMRCRRANAAGEAEWSEKVDPNIRKSVERYYRESEEGVYGNLWWHTLNEDNSPLAYVLALHFARQQRCSRYLDFGAGVGSGALLFAQHRFDVTLVEISLPRLRFSEWRFKTRNFPAKFVDASVSHLPKGEFDIITAMDVFEHLFDPVGAVEELWEALRPGGFLFGRIHADPNDERPAHIVHDFEPTFKRMQTLGLVEIWRDEWLWGHRVFQKL